MSKPKPGAVATVRMDLAWYDKLVAKAHEHGLSLNMYLLGLTGKPIPTTSKQPRPGVEVLGVWVLPAEPPESKPSVIHVRAFRRDTPLLQGTWATKGPMMDGPPICWLPLPTTEGVDELNQAQS